MTAHADIVNRNRCDPARLRPVAGSEAMKIRHCSEITRAGTPCKGHVPEGETRCYAHRMSDAEKRALIDASARARRKTVEDRRRAEEDAKLGLKALLGRELEQEATRITERLRSLALSPDDQTALRGLALWFDRVMGRPIQPTEDVTPNTPDPHGFLELSPEERRTLLRALEH